MEANAPVPNAEARDTGGQMRTVEWHRSEQTDQPSFLADVEAGGQLAVKSLPKVTPFSRANPTPLEVSDRLFEVEDRRAVGLRGVIAEVLGSRSFSPCRTPVVAR